MSIVHTDFRIKMSYLFYKDIIKREIKVYKYLIGT